MKRRPKGFEKRAIVTHVPNARDTGTIVVFSVATPIVDPRSLDVLILAARKALSASVLDSEKALLEPATAS